MTSMPMDPVKRPANRKEDWIGRRLAQYQTGTRRLVVPFRARDGRVLPF